MTARMCGKMARNGLPCTQMTTAADCGRHTTPKAVARRPVGSQLAAVAAVAAADPFADPPGDLDGGSSSPSGARWVGDPDDPRRHTTRFFHGTTAVLGEGDEVVPADRDGRRRMHSTIGHGDMAYATGTESDGWKWAELAWNNADGGRPRVYEVEPVGEWLGDDEDDAGSEALMSPDGWRVIGAVPFPEAFGGDDADWA